MKTTEKEWFAKANWFIMPTLAGVNLVTYFSGRREMALLGQENLTRKLAAYSLATSTGLLATELVDAAVVPFQPPTPLVYDASSGPLFVSFDIDGDSNLDFYIEGAYEQYEGDYFGSFTMYNFGDTWNSVFFEGSYLAKIFAPGELIAPIGTNANNFAFLPISLEGYVGVRFDIPGGSPHFGYLDIEISGPDNEILTLYGGAYESLPNTPILAGGIPEPSGLALLAGGASALTCWRRRKLA